MSLEILTNDQVQHVRREFGTPVFVYDQGRLEQAARQTLAFPNAFGLTARYAIKALPTAAIIQVLSAAGLHIDASSGFEAHRAMVAGVSPERIQITAQEIPSDLKGIVQRLFLTSIAPLRRTSPRNTTLRSNQSRPGQRPQQPNQRRGTVLKFRHMA